MCLRIFSRAMATSIDDLKSPLLWRAVIAEFLGTLLLVFVGCGSCIGWGEDYSPTIVQISLTFGLSVATIVWVIGHVSGGHINPAVTAGMLVTRKISLARALFFVVAQCFGSMTGAAILKGLTPASARGPLGTTSLNASLLPIQGFGVELIITFVLVLTVFGTCDGGRTDLKGSGPHAIGLSITMCHLFAIKYTGSSMNPARSLGPAVVMDLWEEHWIYWCGPLLGGIAAGLVYDTFLDANASLSKARAFLTSTYDPAEYLPINNQNRGSTNNNQFLIEDQNKTGSNTA